MKGRMHAFESGWQDIVIEGGRCMFNRSRCIDVRISTFMQSLALSVLVRVRDAHELRLIRTYPNVQLKAPTESNDVSIRGMCASADGGSLVCADMYNGSVKGVELATGSLNTLYKETERGWRVSNALIAVRPDGTHSLIVVESRAADKAKRLVVADRVAPAGNFSRTYEVKWMDDTNVCNLDGRITSSYPPTSRPTLPLSALPLCSSISPPPNNTHTDYRSY